MDVGRWLVAAILAAATVALVVRRLLRQGGAGSTVSVGRYVVDGVLGSGSASTVYRGHHPDTGELVAVKIFDATTREDARLREGIRHEVAALRALTDPSCVRIRDVIDDGHYLAVVTDYVDGATLQAVLAEHGHLRPDQACAVLAGALGGLAHLHALGLVHRDVKPANILVERSGRSRLVDFGLTRPAAVLAGTAEYAGSPAYMSPEQVRLGVIDARSDVYNCGAVLYEVLTGVQPFGTGTPAEVARRRLDVQVPDPRTDAPGLDGAVADLVMGAMAVEPADRPADAAVLLEELEETARHAFGATWRTGAALGALAGGAGGAVAGLHSTAAATATAPLRVTRWAAPGTHTGIAAATGALTAAAVLVLGAATSGPDGSGAPAARTSATGARSPGAATASGQAAPTSAAVTPSPVGSTTAGSTVPVVACALDEASLNGASPPAIPTSTSLPSTVREPSGAAVYGSAYPGAGPAYALAPDGYLCSSYDAADGAITMILQPRDGGIEQISDVFVPGGVGFSVTLACPYIDAARRVAATFGSDSACVRGQGEKVTPLDAGQPDHYAVLIQQPPVAAGEPAAVTLIEAGVHDTGDQATAAVSARSVSCELPVASRDICIAALDLFLAQPFSSFGDEWRLTTAQLARLRDAIDAIDTTQ